MKKTAIKYLNLDGLRYFWSKIKAALSEKVDKVEGKGLSTEDYTTEEKTKLAGVETGANKYVHPAYTARTGKPTANAAPAFGGTVTVSQIKSDATGHVTAATDRTITIPDDEASSTAHGLMSAADKGKLDGVEAGANLYVHPAYTARTGKPTANAAPAFGGTVTVSQIKSDATGHVTAATDRTITIPDAEASSTAHGLMSAADKEKLDGFGPASDYATAAQGAKADAAMPIAGGTFTGPVTLAGDPTAVLQPATKQYTDSLLAALKAQVIEAAHSTFSATGALVTCNPVPSQKLHFVCHLEPVQEGEGDPSPENVRPIRACGTVTVKRFGANLLNKSGIVIGTNGGTVTQTVTGVKIDSPATATANVLANYGGLTPHLVDGETYTVSAIITALTARARLSLLGINGTASIYKDRTTTGKLSLTFTWDSTKYSNLRLHCTYTAAATGSVTYDEIMLVHGETDAEYVPFVSWSSVSLAPPSGAYGGDYDSEGSFAPLRVGGITSGSRSYANAGSVAGNLYIRNVLAGYLSGDGGIYDVAGFLCTMYKPMPYAGIDDRQNGCVYFGNGAIYICDTDHMTEQTSAGLDAYFSWLDSVGGMNICGPYYPGKEPTPTAVDEKTLVSAFPAQLNHLWTSAGTLTVTGQQELGYALSQL